MARYKVCELAILDAILKYVFLWNLQVPLSDTASLANPALANSLLLYGCMGGGTLHLQIADIKQRERNVK